jgi:malonyl-CoA O-methyltransferase
VWHGLCHRLIGSLLSEIKYHSFRFFFAYVESSQIKKMMYQLCADFDSLPLAPQSADLIFSNLSLQWSFNLEKTLIAWKNIIKPQGYVCLSSLVSGTLQELHQARNTLGLATNTSRFMAIDDITKIISHHFTVHALTTETVTLSFPDVWSVAKSLKAVGAKAVVQDFSNQKSQGLIGKHYWQALDAHYPRCQQTGIYPLSYELVYAILQVD